MTQTFGIYWFIVNNSSIMLFEINNCLNNLLSFFLDASEIHTCVSSSLIQPPGFILISNAHYSQSIQFPMDKIKTCPIFLLVERSCVVHQIMK